MLLKKRSETQLSMKATLKKFKPLKLINYQLRFYKNSISLIPQRLFFMNNHPNGFLINQIEALITQNSSKPKNNNEKKK